MRPDDRPHDIAGDIDFGYVPSRACGNDKNASLVKRIVHRFSLTRYATRNWRRIVYLVIEDNIRLAWQWRIEKKNDSCGHRNTGIRCGRTL